MRIPVGEAVMTFILRQYLDRYVLQAWRARTDCPGSPCDYHGNHRKAQENGMSMQSEGKDAKGRNYDQVTKDGSSAAGTLGAGGTGDVDRELTQSRAGNMQGGSEQ